MTGAQASSASCLGGTYSISVTKSSDGTYNYSLTQADAAGNVSAATSFQWIRDTQAPSAPTVTTPAANPFTSADTTITIGGACETGASVSISGAYSNSASCAAGTYSFSVTKNTDGTYNFSLSQEDAVGNASSSTSFQWIRDTSVPATPTITTPAASPYTSNGSSLTISGGCTTGHIVTLAGNVVAGDVTSPAGALTQTCASSAYSFAISKSSDSSYTFTVKQTHPLTGINSATASQTWIRDTLAPAAPTVTNPSTNPFTSGDTTITIGGACETGATVSLSGASVGSVTCAASVYSFGLTQSVDGTYDFSLVQTDPAGNPSSTTAFQWILDTSVPSTPVITLPEASPHYSNTSSIVLSGTCTTGYTVTLAGDVVAGDVTSPAGSLTQTCASSAFSFTIAKSTDGAYGFGVEQTNTATEATSAQASLTWIRDTVAPGAPVITTPSSSPYTASGNLALAGTCETGATVTLAGDDSQTASCAAGTFSFTIVKSTDATYNFSVTQADAAGNASSAATQQWLRDSSVPATPTITVPASSPYLSNSEPITISGGCETGLTVTLGGDVIASEVTSPAASLTQTCALSTYSYTVTKSVDGVYNFTVKQTSASMIDSGTAMLQWTLDRVAPETTIDSSPADPNLSGTAVFAFSASETGSTFECQLDGGGYSTCVSPYTLSSLSNGSHTFEISARDAAGNLDATPASYTWNQGAYNTVALYHFDTATGDFTDSGLFTGLNHNDLTNAGTTAGATAKFGQSRALASASSQYASAPHTISQSLMRTRMTVEGFVKLASLPTNMVIASKMGASGQFGWNLKLIKQGSKYYLAFVGSLNGTTTTEVRSASLTLDTTSFHHYAVTWNQGSIAFYMDGVKKGTGTIGTAGSATLFDSTADLHIGRDQTGNYLNGTIDEVRCSQIIRWTSNFTPPASPYTAD